MQMGKSLPLSRNFHLGVPYSLFSSFWGALLEQRSMNYDDPEGRCYSFHFLDDKLWLREIKYLSKVT